MTDKEALKLALELALDVRANANARLAAKAIALTGVIDAALAEQPAQQQINCKHKRENNGVCPHHNLHCGWPKCNEPAQQQEPVAVDVTIDDEDALSALRDTIVQSNGDLTAIRLLVGNGHSGYGLYVANAEYQEEGALLLTHTSPQPSKPWVGLTDEERAFCVQATVGSGDAVQLMCAIEAKLREKNA